MCHTAVNRHKIRPILPTFVIGTEYQIYILSVISEMKYVYLQT